MARSGKYNILLSWYNSLGGIELFNFTAKKSYSYAIRDAQISKRDVYENWDTEFTDGRIDHDLLSIKANERIIVRTQDLSAQQATAIAQIKFSPRIFDVEKDVAVRIDRTSIRYRTDGDKRHEIEFAITYPDLVVV